jgi:enoyl-CoA hydratase/carnithine racemase
MAGGSESGPSRDAVVLDVEDGIATITLNRPERRNAVDYGGWKLLRDTARAVAERDDVRVVVITGAGDNVLTVK